MSTTKRSIWLCVLLAGWLGAARPARTPKTPNAQSPDLAKPRAANLLDSLPLVFEPNLGQTDPQVHFLTRAAGMTSFLTDRENVMVLSRRKGSADPNDPQKDPGIEQAVVRMKLEGARRPRHFQGLDPAGSISNYFIGNDPSRWVANVPHYRKVRAEGVYPGIDLVYYGAGRKLEYDFIVRPGSDPNQIHLAYSGTRSLSTDADGNLLIGTRLGPLVQQKPVVYQEVDGERKQIAARYSIRAGRVEIALAEWDKRRELVIDPPLLYSTYLGGNSTDVGNGIAVDASGAAYVTGETQSTDFPTTAGAFQTAIGAVPRNVFVAKLNPSGTALEYSTYLAANNGSYALGIAVDFSGAAYVTGRTAATNFPVTPGAFQTTKAASGLYDVFVTKLNATGSALLYSTYLGGTGVDRGFAIAVDISGAAYVTGITDSTNFPTTPSAYQTSNAGGSDVFVTKLNAAGNALQYSTYLGGAGSEQANGIAVDSSGAAYVTGFTQSTNFPATSGAFQTVFGGNQDAFVTKLNATGTGLVYSTYLGGTGNEQANGIAVDSSGAAYVTGFTQSTNFPATSGAFQTVFGGNQDAFVTKLNATGTGLVYSTYLGGNAIDVGGGIAVDATGAAYIAGYTASANFPTAPGAFQTTFAGGNDIFVTKLNATGNALLYSTYLGGSSADNGNGIAVDSSGDAYVTGSTGSTNFPTTPGAPQAGIGGGSQDAFVTKLSTAAPAPANIVVAGGSPQATEVNTAFFEPLTVRVTDINGQPVSDVPVIFIAPGGGPSALLIPPTVTTDNNGFAGINAVANNLVGSYPVKAVVDTPTGQVSVPFDLTNLPATAGAIAFVQQPSNSQAGAPISPAGPVAVEVRDRNGNPIVDTPIAVSLLGGPGPLNGNLVQLTDPNGIAIFPDLNITVVGTYELEARELFSGLATISVPFNITAGSSISITPEGGGGQTEPAGTVFPARLEAFVKDAFGNPVAGAPATFTAPSGGATVTFNGATSVTIATGSNGIAIAPPMTAGTTTGSFQVTAATPGAPEVAVFPLTIVAGTANRVAFVQQPSNIAAGTNITPPVTVQFEDSFGNAVPQSGINITLQLDPSQTLLGTVTQPTNANGQAVFPDLTVHQVGQYQLLAESTGVDSALSNPFTVRAGGAATIHMAGGTPQSASILTPFPEPLAVVVTDSFNNAVSEVTVAFAAPASGASATLSASAAATDASGHAAVTATANNVAGGYTVTASVTGVAGTAAFTLTNVAGPVGQITFVQQPSNSQAGVPITPAVVERLVDGGGNPVSGATVTVSLLGGTATLNGTLTGITDASGEVTFSDVTINTAGTYQLEAASGGISAISNSFTIGTSTAATLISVFTGDGQSAPVGGPYAEPLQALVTDLYGNVLVNVPVAFSVPTSGASVTFNGSATVNTDANGIATSPALTANAQTGTFAVSATTAGALAPATFTLTNLPADAERLAFVQQPTNTAVGATLAPPVTVQLEDSAGNPVQMAGVPITVLERLRAFSGTATEPTGANGIATFPDLSFAVPGNHRLEAVTTGVASAASNLFIVGAGTPTMIEATGGTPQGAIINTAFGVPLQATVTDLLGDPVPGVPVTFTAPASGAGGLFNGQPTVTVNTDARGEALASITANGITGTYGVVASTTAVSGAAEFILTNLPAAANVLAFIQQPGNTAAGQAIAPPVTVQVQDGSGHAVAIAGVPVVLSLASGTGILQGTLVQLTDSTGTATFPDLKINQVGAKQLRALSGGEVPATSVTFQIMAGAAVNISVFSGAPQATIVLQPFAPLQAQVTDSAGNPVSGVAVTFVAPSSGPSGTFAGATTVTTNANGVATAPALTANATPGSFLVTATAAGVVPQALFSLTNLPNQPPSVTVDTPQLSFASQANQPAPPGQIVQIDANAGVTWTVASTAPWLTATPAGGNGNGQITVTVNPAGLAPGTYNGSIVITDSGGGVTVIPVTYVVSNQPALVITPPALVFATTSNTITPSPQVLQATTSQGTIAYRVAAQVSTPAGGTWLQVTPAQGQTVGTVQVSVNPAGLAQGVYNGSILFTPTDTTINSVAVPVTLIVDCQEGGCTITPNILAVVNGASFHPSGAPGAIMTIFGTNLSDAVHQAQSFPLPTTLGPTSVTVNGTTAPLIYASPTQINFQMPSNAPAAASVVVNNTALSGPSSQGASAPYIRTLTAVDPGLFINNPGNRAAALNADLSPHTPATPIPAGGFVLLFLTGQGPVTPPVADGTPAPGNPLSIINGTVQVTIGGVNAQITYQGLAPGFAGLAQINAIVPAGLAPGNQPVFITINGQPSNAGLITVQ